MPLLLLILLLYDALYRTKTNAAMRSAVGEITPCVFMATVAIGREPMNAWSPTTCSYVVCPSKDRRKIFADLERFAHVSLNAQKQGCPPLSWSPYMYIMYYQIQSWGQNEKSDLMTSHFEEENHRALLKGWQNKARFAADLRFTGKCFHKTVWGEPGCISLIIQSQSY